MSSNADCNPGRGDAAGVIYDVISAQQMATLSGLQVLQGIASGELPQPPISATFDFHLAQVEAGRVVFAGVPDFRFYNPIGCVHGGYAATLLDSCMGCAVHSTLAAGIGYTTIEFKVTFLRPLTHATGRVLAEGKVIQSGKRVALAEGVLRDERGKLYATATTSCLVFPLSASASE